jgi:hypothetical protein
MLGGMLGDEEDGIARSRQLYVLVDASAFGRRAWIQAMVDASEAGHVRLYWSPIIIEEMARFRQLLWIRKWMLGGGTRLSFQVRRRLLEESHRWMDAVAPHFHVVDDTSPRAPAWSDRRTPRDAPIWVAARRAQVDVIVTYNPRTAPPPNEHGIQIFEDILYLDPASLPALLDRWGDICQTGPLLPELEDEADDGWIAPPVEEALPPAIVDFLYGVVRRREEELQASTEERPDDEP